MINRPILVITIVYVAIILFSDWTASLLLPEKRHNHAEKPIALIGIVNNEPAPKESGVSFELKIKNLKKKGGYKPFNGTVQVFSFSPKEKVVYGDLIEISGIFSSGKPPSNPGEFDYSDYLERKGILGAVSVFPPKNKVKVIARNRGNWFIARSLKLKNKLVGIHQKTIPAPYAGLFGSILFGLKASPISDDMRGMYQKSGVVHILVASGQQVSILIGVCLAFGLALRAPLPLISIVTVLLTWGFAAMAGFGSSIVRAAIMGSVMIAARLFDREGDFYSSLALAALVLLIMNPNNLFDIGFQLSFLATWSLVYIAPVLSDFMSKYMPKFFAATLSIAIAPVVVTTPISIYYFSQLTFIAVVANILVVPLAELLTTLGFISTAASLIFLPVAAALNGFMLLVMIFLNNAVGFFSSVPGAYAYIVRPNIIFILFYYAFIVYLTEQIRSKIYTNIQCPMTNWKLGFGNWILVIGVLIFAFWIFFSPLIFASKQFTMTVLDVGQGDSILLEMPDGKNVLIDGGGKLRGGEKIGSKIVVPLLHRKGINKLDMVVLTHPHADHAGGLAPVLEEIKVDSVLDSGQKCSSGHYRRFLRLINKNRIKYSLGRAGQSFNFGAVKGYVLAPFDTFIQGTQSDLNNNSIVMRFVYGGTSMLLMGDAAFEEEAEILKHGFKIKSDVIKIGHHGSATSSSDEFLKEVSPKYAIISTGAKNRYGHPTAAALERLQKIAKRIFRTDLSGAVIVKSDGKRLVVETGR